MIPAPVFIHSLFRSGSTYMFQVFRRAEEGNWCYEEPLHELMLKMASEGEKLLQDTKLKNEALRHPVLDKPYLTEYMPISTRIGESFAKRFPYDTYFLNPLEKDDELRRYLSLLIEAAHGRPVLQLCRSSGRIEWIKKLFGGIHLFIWRNPWDQWWSYQVDPYFNTVNFLILNAPTAPPSIRAVRTLIGLNEYHSSDIAEEFVFFSMRQPDSAASYLAFYAVWLHAMLEALPKADLAINMEQLSDTPAYQHAIKNRLHELGVSGVDFSDCNIHQSVFLEGDKSFFQEVEETVHRIFLENGYSQVDLDSVTQLRGESDAQASARGNIQEDLARARNLLRREMADAASLRQRVIERNQEIAREIQRRCLAEEELFRVHRSFSWRSTSGFRRVYRYLLDIYHWARNRLASGKTE